MKTLLDIQQQWQETLSSIYPEREINNLFRFALEDVLDMPQAQQVLERNRPQSGEKTKKLQSICDRLLTGEPLQYITGFTYFDDLKLMVSPSVLIPRPETEELVDWIAQTLEKESEETIIDWCTGSGCIALALKKRFPKSRVIGYDWSVEALAVASQNADSLQLSIELERKDALMNEYSADPVSVIVSNPPYIPEQEKTLIRSNVRDFEPYMALFVPNDRALLFYEAITKKAIDQLKSGGWLFFELHEDYAEETKSMVETTEQFESVEIRNDLQGKARMLRAQKI